MRETEVAQIMALAEKSGIAHNGGAGGQYLLCATEAQLTKFVASLETRIREALSEQWQPIETAPRSFVPPLSPVVHHAPDILGLWGQAFYCVCSWGGPSQPFWIGGDNRKIPFQPTHWMPLPAAPSGAAKEPT